MRRAVLRLLAGLALAGGAAGVQAGQPGAVQPGDLIFRKGTEDVSRAVLSLDGGPYSHVGMLVGEPGRWQVLHATPSEVPGRPDGVVLDSLDFFLDAERTERYAVYRVEADDIQRERAVQAARAMLDRPFRVADPEGTYCTLLVWDAWRQAGLDMDARFTRLNLPLMPGDYLMPNGLLASGKLIEVTIPGALR